MRLTGLIEDEGMTLMVTHNLEQALNIGNRTIMMHEGRIILDLGKSRRIHPWPPGDVPSNQWRKFSCRSDAALTLHSKINSHL